MCEVDSYESSFLIGCTHSLFIGLAAEENKLMATDNDSEYEPKINKFRKRVIKVV